MRCCLMSLLLKCLMICSKILSYFPTSTYDLNPKPNSDLPIISIRCHRVSLVIATATNPRQIGLTDRDLGLTEMGLQTLCYLLHYSRSHRDMQSVPPSCLANSLFHLLPKSVPPSLSNRSNRVLDFP